MLGIDAALAERTRLGTLYVRRALPYRSYWYRIFVKATKTQWAKASGRAASGHGDGDFRLDAALADLRTKLATSSPAEWKVKPASIVEALSDGEIWRTDLIALEGADPRSNAYFCRRRTRLAIR